jgi:hypothetical protein
MPDIWSGIGSDISHGGEGEWLYRVGGEIRGPVSMQILAQKLVRGEIDLETQVAHEGGEFHPISRVAAFAPHITEAKKQLGKRHAAKTRRLLVMLAVPALALIGVVGYFVWLELGQRRHKAELEARAKLAELARQRKKAESLPDMGLVALVSLGNEDSVKIHSGASPKRAGAGRRHGAEAAQAEPTELVQECKLSQGDILGTLRKHLAKINFCVEDERTRDKEGLLPPTLELEFVVQTSGRVTDFALTDRHYRKGPLNNCFIKAFSTIQFPASNGANCPVTIPIKIGK